MQAISAAVQEGARAYLNRQYITIAGVGVVVFILLIPLQNIRVAIGFAIGGGPIGSCRLHRYERVRPGQRAGG